MSEADTQDQTSLMFEDAAGRLFLKLEQDDAAEVVERLRETRADALGRAYLLRLDLIIERLGERWEAKRELVFNHLKTAFERKFQEPDWCVRINDDSFLAVILTLGEYKGALSAAELWYSSAHFFVGDVSGAPPPLYEAIVDDVRRLRVIPIDLSKYFDRAEARPFRQDAAAIGGGDDTEGRQASSVGVMRPMSGSGAGLDGGVMRPISGSGAGLDGGIMRTTAATGSEPEPGLDRPTSGSRAAAPHPGLARPAEGNASVSSLSSAHRIERNGGPSEVGVMRTVERSSSPVPVMTVGSRQLRVICSLQPLFEMKKLAVIGHRFEPIVTEAGTGFPVDAKALAHLDWSDREQIDIACVEQGIKLLQMRPPEQRRMVMFVPAAFSTFASAKARGRLAPMVAQAAQVMGLKVLFEIRHLNGVPPGRVSEVASLLRPYCMTTMGHASAEPRAIAALKGCNLSGVSVDYDGVKRDDAALTAYLSGLAAAGRQATGAFMIQGLDNLHQMAVSRLANASHATIKASALIASRQ